MDAICFDHRLSTEEGPACKLNTVQVSWLNPARPDATTQESHCRKGHNVLRKTPFIPFAGTLLKFGYCIYCTRIYGCVPALSHTKPILQPEVPSHYRNLGHGTFAFASDRYPPLLILVWLYALLYNSRSLYNTILSMIPSRTVRIMLYCTVGDLTWT
jgi:hypothetical protein